MTGGSTPDLRNLGHSLPNAKSLREHLLTGGKSDFHSSPSKPTTSHLSQQEAFIQRLKEENAQLKREAAAREAKLQGLRPQIVVIFQDPNKGSEKQECQRFSGILEYLQK